MSALIKGVIDTIRGMPGYAGMAVYFAHDLAYLDILEEMLADGMYELFMAGSHVETITAIVRGYSIIIFNAGDMAVVARFEGRYPGLPKICPEDDDIALVEPAPRLMSREEARREALELLKSFNILSHD